MASKPNLQAYKFQLEQVQASLDRDPENARFRALLSKLQSMIALLEGPPVSTIEAPNNTAQRSNLSESVEKPGGERTKGSRQTDRADSGQGGEGTSSAAPSKTRFDLSTLRVGDVCEAKCSHDGHWYEAVVQSYAPDHSVITVVFSGGVSETQHCSHREIRQADPEHSRKKKLPPPPKAAAAAATATTHSSHPSARAFNSGPNGAVPSKRKPNRQEYVQKKEAEHKERQDSWKQFKNKIARSSLGAAASAKGHDTP